MYHKNADRSCTAEFLVQVTVSYPATQIHAQICVPAQKHYEDSSVNISVNLSYSKLELYLCDILQNTSVFTAINVARVKKKPLHVATAEVIRIEVSC